MRERAIVSTGGINVDVEHGSVDQETFGRTKIAMNGL